MTSNPKLDFLGTAQLAGICVLYALGVAVVQFLVIAPSRLRLLERISHMKERLETLHIWAPPRSEQEKKQLESRGERLLHALERPENFAKRSWFSTSKVQAAWRQVHDIEVDLVNYLPAKQIDVELATMPAWLEASDRVDGRLLAETIKSALENDEGGRPLENAKELYAKALQITYDVNDTNYEDDALIFRKTVWLTSGGLSLIVLLGAFENREVLFLLGASGGFLSRLARILRRRPRTTDYGASWSTLVMSPVWGALAGWFGVLLVGAFADRPYSLFTEELDKVTWPNPGHPVGLSLAFLFGFSERLFNRLIDKTSAAVIAEEEKASARK